MFSFLARSIWLRLMFYINRVKIANSGPKGHTHQHNLSSEVLLTLIFPCMPGPLKYTTHLTQSHKQRGKKKKPKIFSLSLEDHNHLTIRGIWLYLRQHLPGNTWDKYSSLYRKEYKSELSAYRKKKKKKTFSPSDSLDFWHPN